MTTRFAIPPGQPARSPIIRVYQVAGPAIQFLTGLVEGGDGIGVVRTLDEQRGIIECWIMPDFADEFEQALNATARRWPVQPLGREFA